MSEVAEKIRRICARLLDEPPHSAKWRGYRSDLKAAARELAAERKAWGKPAETDTHRGEARQSYSSREKDSADGFAEGMKLFKRTKQDSEKKKD